MTIRHLQGHCVDVMASLEPQSINTVITSPPYWGLRKYGTEPQTWADGWVGELGQEPTPQAYVQHLLEVFDAVARVLRTDGVAWVNLGDTYASASGPQSPTGLDGRTRAGTQHSERPSGDWTPGLPAKSLVGIPWRFALAMQDRGWLLRQDIIWAKSNPMPESVRDRCTRSHEYIFIFALKPHYHWNHDANQETGISPTGTRRNRLKTTKFGETPGFEIYRGLKKEQIDSGYRNRRSVWTVAHSQYKDAHFATFPANLIRPMVRIACPPNGWVLDPFGGAGTTAMVAQQEARHCVSIELRPEYHALGADRSTRVTPAMLPLPLDWTCETPTFAVHESDADEGMTS